MQSSHSSRFVVGFGGALVAFALPGLLLLSSRANAYEEAYSFPQDESRDHNGQITVEESIIHVIECIDAGENGGEMYVYEYVNRPGFRAILPGDWAHAIGGKDFDTYEEAAFVACGGDAGGGGGGYEELYSFPQAEARDGSGNITVEASTIHVIECLDGGGQFYIYEYVNRPGFRAIQPPDWAHAIGGQDFDTFEDAAFAACMGGGGGGGGGGGHGGGGGGGGADGYLGCFMDDGDRDLNGYKQSTDDNSPEECIETCYDRGFAYAGVQYSSECFCGDSYGRLGPATNCDMTCSGDQDETCGGSWANDVWATGAAGGGGGRGHDDGRDDDDDRHRDDDDGDDDHHGRD